MTLACAARHSCLASSYRGALDGAAYKIPRALAVTGRGGEKGAEACEHLTDALVAIVPRLDPHTPANTPLSTGDEVTLTMTLLPLQRYSVFLSSTDFGRQILGISPKWVNMGQHGSIVLNSPGQELSIDL